MKTPFRCFARALALALDLVLGACASGLQGPTIRLESVAQSAPSAGPGWQQTDPVAAGVRVRRGGGDLRPSIGMLLQPGDEIETGPLAAAVLRYSASGTTVLDTDTRVRVGSLEVFFGRVFADVRGFFQVSSETVVAGVSGTRFLFDVRPDRTTRVAVVEGEVTCSPRQGGWAPVRLRPNEALQVGVAERGQPQGTAADPREFRDAADWAERVRGARPEGWCCMNGRVTESSRSECFGSFSDNPAAAQSACVRRYEPPRRRDEPPPRRDEPPPRRGEPPAPRR